MVIGDDEGLNPGIKPLVILHIAMKKIPCLMGISFMELNR